MTDKPPAMPELPDGATVLPDGSAFALASFPLPANHWLYAPREYRDGEEDPIELPPPILSHQVHGDIVRAAIRYAVRSATMCGKEPDFDPDALVQNAMYALCGPFGGAALQSAQPAAAMSDEEIRCLGQRNAWHYKYSSDPAHSSTYKFNDACLLQFARAILAQRPAAQTEREAFEAEMRCEETWGHRSLKKRPDGRYQNWQVDVMWEAWQARASLPAAQQATPEPVQPRTFDARNAQFREHNWQIRFDAAVDARRLAQERLYSERERHTAEVKRLQLEIGRLTATPEPVGEALQFPPMPEGWPARFRCDSCDGNGEIGELVSTGHFQPPERQTCPDCGGRGWTSEEHAFNADHMREFAEAHALLTHTAPGVPEDVHTGDDLPPAGKFVIAWVEGLKAPLRAMWVPDFHLPANEDADPGWAKYSEEHDAYFAPSGWYECNHCDETNWQIHERVLAWSHLPVIDRAALAAAQAKGGV